MGRKLTRNRPPQGERIATLRKAAGLSQAELARLIGVHQQTIAFWELSDKPPRSEVLAPMATVLGVGIEDILGEESRAAAKSGPTGKVHRLFTEVSRLPRRQQDKVVEFVSAFVNQHRESAG